LADITKPPCFLSVIALREIIRNFQTVCKDFASLFGAICCGFRMWVASVAKQTKITIESDSLLILRGRSSSRAWCRRCGADAEMIALENIGVISNLERTALEEWLNSGELHRSQGADGSAQVCLNSLLVRVQNTKAS
jgi:hypothetical protein